MPFCHEKFDFEILKLHIFILKRIECTGTHFLKYKVTQTATTATPNTTKGNATASPVKSKAKWEEVSQNKDINLEFGTNQ